MTYGVMIYEQMDNNITIYTIFSNLFINIYVNNLTQWLINYCICLTLPPILNTTCLV